MCYIFFVELISNLYSMSLSKTSWVTLLHHTLFHMKTWSASAGLGWLHIRKRRFTAAKVTSWSKAIVSNWLTIWMELAARVGQGRGCALGTGAWQREQVDDGQLKSGERGRGASILEDSWGSERPWKKAAPSGSGVGAGAWKRSRGWRLTLSLLFFGNAAGMGGALLPVGGGAAKQ